MATATVTELNLKVEDVGKVYSGKDGKCCCGCSGKYYYHSTWQHLGSLARGYTVDDDQISDKMVAKVVRILNEADPANIDVGSNYYATVIGSRLYIACPKATNAPRN